jgi:hypothetical protein
LTDIARKNGPKRLRVSTLKTEQACVAEMCRLYKMARHGEIGVADLMRYVQAINTVHNALTIGRYGAEIEELKEAIDQRKAENAPGAVLRLRRVQ